MLHESLALSCLIRQYFLLVGQHFASRQQDDLVTDPIRHLYSGQ
jgi:hypothetical protein